MNIKRIIPDIITCCNLLCGCIAVYLATQGSFAYAFLFIVGGAFFDFFDGMSARLLKVVNRIGIELDSLADDITFGLAPAMMLTCYLLPMIGYWAFIALLMAAFSALRLAKFNNDERQTTSFIGLATPANAIFWASICTLPLDLLYLPGMPWILLALSLVSCYLLVSEIPFFSLKFHDMTWTNNAIRYIFLFGTVVLVAVSVMEAIRYQQWTLILVSGAVCIIWYCIINLINLIIYKR